MTKEIVMAGNDTDMTHIDQKLFKLAAMVDTTIRFHCDSLELDEMEENYLNVWLKKERDPLIVVILATLTGARDPAADVDDAGDAVGEAEADAA